MNFYFNNHNPDPKLEIPNIKFISTLKLALLLCDFIDIITLKKKTNKQFS